MKLRAPLSLMVVTLAAGVLGLSACNQRSTSNTASTPAPATTPPVTTTERLADKASEATNKVAVAADDAAITAKIKAALLVEPGLKSLEISVDTKDGAVTLSGKVDSADQRERAKQVAQTTSGVKNVVDNLSVKS